MPDERFDPEGSSSLVAQSSIEQSAGPRPGSRCTPCHTPCGLTGCAKLRAAGAGGLRSAAVGAPSQALAWLGSGGRSTVALPFALVACSRLVAGHGGPAHGESCQRTDSRGRSHPNTLWITARRGLLSGVLPPLTRSTDSWHLVGCLRLLPSSSLPCCPSLSLLLLSVSCPPHSLPLVFSPFPSSYSFPHLISFFSPALPLFHSWIRPLFLLLSSHFPVPSLVAS
jgi:hypothetical protein